MTFFFWARYVFLLVLLATVLLFAWWSIDSVERG
jgi:hypothetical protein